MGNSDSVIPSEVRDLIQESQKIRGWVDRLADHAGEARPEVVDKVRQDYEDRLQAVNGQLAQHRVSLTDTLETRRGEVESLRVDRDEHAMELEEARIRHSVGEFSDSQWKKRKEGIEQTLEDLDGLLGMEEETVAELADIIGRIGGAGPRLVTDDEAAKADGIDEVEDAPDYGTVEDDTAEDAVAEEEPEELDELDAIEAAVEDAAVEDAAAEAEAAEAVSEASDAPDDDEGGEYLDELEFLESLSLGDADRFDAVSAMLDEEDGGKGSD